MPIYNAFYKPRTRSQRGESPGRLLSFHRIFFPTWLLIFRPYVPVSSVVLQGNITEFKALDGRHETFARQFYTRNIQWKSNATGFSFIGAFRPWRKRERRRKPARPSSGRLNGINRDWEFLLFALSYIFILHANWLVWIVKFSGTSGGRVYVSLMFNFASLGTINFFSVIISPRNLSKLLTN